MTASGEADGLSRTRSFAKTIMLREAMPENEYIRVIPAQYAWNKPHSLGRATYFDVDWDT